VTLVGGIAREVADASISLSRRARREAFVARIRAAAWKASATVDIEVAPDLRIGRDVRVTVDPGTHTVLRWGPDGRIDDRVLLALKGGELLAGDKVEVRRDCVLNITGTLRIDGDTPISWGSVIHCSEEIVLERMVGIAEQVTIADSSHYFTEPDVHFWHNVRTGAVRVGSNTWLCPKSVLTRGADVGRNCIVAAGSVVTGVVPDGHLATGVPATTRPLALPWRTPEH
jgi:acetyltransferase-like isoleucine patch superfamily enzyme